MEIILILKPDYEWLMLDFLRKWFGRNPRSTSSGAINDPVLDLGPDIPAGKTQAPDADVHQLMIRATAIRRKEGYPAAVKFLKELAEIYLVQENTALVTCVNKLIRYMKRSDQESWESTHQVLQKILEKLPDTDSYFLNLHITMAELLEHKGVNQAIAYLKEFLKTHPPSLVTYYHLIKLSDLYGVSGTTEKAKEHLSLAKTFWNEKLNRTVLIKMQRRWYRSASGISFCGSGQKDKMEYLFYRFMEFALDMARVLDPAQIDEFHKRKDQYFHLKRGFETQETFNETLELLNLTERKEELCRRIYGYVFEEMPVKLGISEKQLYFKPGDSETLEEVRQKKIFSEKPFTERPILEADIRHLVDQFIF